MSKDIRAMIVDICKRTLENQIDIAEFYDKWPSNAFENPFFEQIYEDLENAISHAPGFFLKKGVDREAWKNSFDYLIIYLDYVLLHIKKNEKDLLYLRNKIIELKDISIQMIDKIISDITSDNSVF